MKVVAARYIDLAVLAELQHQIDNLRDLLLACYLVQTELDEMAVKLIEWSAWLAGLGFISLHLSRCLRR